MSDITVEPVVVKPDMVSKKASVILIPSILMNGIIPMKEKSTHVSATTIKLSARDRYLSILEFFACHLLRLIDMAPMKKLIIAHVIKIHQSASLYRRLTNDVRIRNSDSNWRSVPKIFFFI
jgi:hypothetical protein